MGRSATGGTALAVAAGAERDDGGGAGGFVRVKRAALAACLTCQLCARRFRDAATITECLHTFCRKCIHEEFINKQNCCCPTCGIILGCAPLDKLRVDHSLQYIRSKIFPSKRWKVETAEVTSPVASPIMKKERSLSLLTTHASQVSMQKCLTKRRTKASRFCNPSLHQTLRGSNTRKKLGGWRALSSQLRVAKNKRSLRSNSEDLNRAESKPDNPADGTPVQSKTMKRFTKRGKLEQRTGTKKLLMLKGKQKKIKAKLPNKKRLQALWFYLVAAFDQKGQPPLPQVPSKFLRIKDVDLPASFVHKYLVQKLNLSSEAEVELLCSGKPVSPAVSLHDLADCWLDKGPKGRVRCSVGSPATGFVATLFYGRPEVPPPETEKNGV